MTFDLQNTIALALTVMAAGYLVVRVGRGLVKKTKGGCASSCGQCANQSPVELTTLKPLPKAKPGRG